MLYIILVCVAIFQYADSNDCCDESSNCANWKNNNFCQYGFYSTKTRYDYCRLTCQLCGIEYVGPQVFGMCPTDTFNLDGDCYVQVTPQPGSCNPGK
ncbi:hypothetical protein WR25_08488 [Diploscapter pachys]|uniref:ShKT domain-containing protein n=1 Tax=Diploscapter pachys TaxID=2018661 RepID=A0A2A2LFL5_9BILA|nr:hypothetical protein WR25_08488 [Diploscapter pachys]